VIETGREKFGPNRKGSGGYARAELSIVETATAATKSERNSKQLYLLQFSGKAIKSVV
jgi:hypothetical protein